MLAFKVDSRTLKIHGDLMMQLLVPEEPNVRTRLDAAYESVTHQNPQILLCNAVA